MTHDTPLISTIVAALVLAFVLGALANRFRMPPLVGYLVAGVLVGPHTPGFVADAGLATELSEIGVILLMFGVGLHFSLKDLLSVRALAVPGAVVQIVGATGMGWGLATLMGWSWGGGLIFGLALSVASTVVLLKALQDRHMVESERGRIAVGWLIVEDLAMVLALVLIPALAGLSGAINVPHDSFTDLVERLTGAPVGLAGVLVLTFIKLAAFVGFMLIVGRRVIPAILHYTAHTGSRELFRLAVLAIALGVAAGAAYLFGVSLALGAFFAGMILSESQLSQRAAQESLPLRDAFAVLFFVSVGMLFDPTVLLRDPLPVLATLAIIILGKSALSFAIVMAFRQGVGTALTISASLAQVGEFSFILASLGVALGLLPPEGRDLILAGAILSILFNPLVFWGADVLRKTIETRRSGGRHEPSFEAPAVAETAPEADVEGVLATSKQRHCVVIGYGRVGSSVADTLAGRGAEFVIVEDADDRVLAARAKGFEVISGNAVLIDVLDHANVAGASTIIVAIPNTFEAGQAVEQARRRNGGVPIIARAHSDEEESHLTHLGANLVIRGEREIALGLVDAIEHMAPRAADPLATLDAADEPPAGPPEAVVPGALVPDPVPDPALGPAPGRARRRRPTAPAKEAGDAFNPETVPPDGK
jgi:CPA2 family monovalent cation:H+ antiporter-2